MAQRIRFGPRLALALFLALIFAATAFAQGRARAQYVIELSDPSVIEEMGRTEPDVPMRAKLRSFRAVEHDAYLAARQEQVIRTLQRVAHLRVQAQTRTVLNAIIAEIDPNDVEAVRAMSGVRAVHRSKEFRLALDAAIPLVRADQAWPLLGGADQAGRGMKIGIIDSGIDISHLMFQDANLTPPAGFPKGESTFTNSKVIVARNYISLLSHPDVQTAEDRNGHGTFAAGAAAGNQATSPRGLISGVAPKAFLGNYKIFGTAGVNDSTNSGAIIAALNQAVQDRMDVVNLSLGGLADALPADDPEVRAVDQAVQANVIVTIAGGNEGQTGTSSISSPGIALSAITVGATTNSRTFHPTLGATAPTPVPPNLQQIGYQIGTGPRINATIGPLPIRDTATLGDRLACNSLPAGSLTGRIALIERGTCFFVDKVTNATNAGALAVIVFNSATQPNEYVIMAGLETTTIPAVFILRGDGLNLQSFMSTNPNAVQVQITNQAATFATTPDVVAAFSSVGPNVDLSIKPDLVAPGVDIFSAAQDNFQNAPLFSANGFLLSNGTSFSAPMVAGAAALVKQLHPTFTPDQVKSVLVSRANQQVTLSGTRAGQSAGIQSRGSGRLDLAAALAARATTTPISISFGNVATLGQTTRTLTIQNFQSAAESYTISVETLNATAAANVTVDRTSVNVAAGGSALINVQLAVAGVTPGVIEGQIRIQPGGGSDLFVPFWGAINGTPSPTNVGAADGDDQDGPAGAQLGQPLVARVTDQNGVSMGGVTVQWTADTGGSVNPASSVTSNFGLAITRATLGPLAGNQTFTAHVGSLTPAEFTARASSGSSNTLAINSISPADGPPSGGTNVVIAGTNFQAGAVVIFGTELAQISSLNATTITVVAPANIPGSVDVSVTNPTGQSVVRTAGFTYLVPSSVELSLTQSSMMFFAATGDTRVQEQSLGITNLAAGATNWTATSTLGGSPPRTWLSITPTSGSTPATLSVRVDPSGLPAGQFLGQVDIAVGSTTTSVLITLNVLTSAPSLLLAQVGDGQLASIGGQFRTSIVLINPNVTAANVTLLFRGDDGSSLNVRLRTGQSGSTFPFTIPARGTLFAETDGSTPTLVVGSAEVRSDVPVGGAAIFLQRVPGRLDFEAAVGLVLPQSSVVLPVDNSADHTTGVAIVNATDQPTNLSLVFRDETGSIRGSSSTALPARGHLSALASDFVSATQGQRGTLTITSDATISAVSVRAQGSGALTTLPAVDTAAPVSNFTLPHIAEGQMAIPSGTVFFDTTWIFLNPGVTSTSSTMSLRDDNGSPLSVTLASGETASEFSVALSARQARFLQTNSSATSLLLGQAIVTGSLPIGGVAVFRQRVPNRPNFEAGVGFSVPGPRFGLPFDNTPGFASGVAVSSTGDSSVTVTFIARREDGSEITRFTRQLPARGHTSFVLPAVATETEGLRGSLELSASAPVITAIGIRALGTGPLTTLPVFPLAP